MPPMGSSPSRRMEHTTTTPFVTPTSVVALLANPTNHSHPCPRTIITTHSTPNRQNPSTTIFSMGATSTQVHSTCTSNATIITTTTLPLVITIMTMRTMILTRMSVITTSTSTKQVVPSHPNTTITSITMGVALQGLKVIESPPQNITHFVKMVTLVDPRPVSRPEERIDKFRVFLSRER